MKIVVSGIFYPITAAIEYLTRAFRRRSDCEVVTVGPYTGSQIPYGISGMTLPDHYAFKPDIILPEGAMRLGNCPISYVEAKLPEGFVPDLWLDVNAGFYLDGRPKNGIRATVWTDPHVLRGLYDSIKPQYDFVFNPQTVYAKENEWYLPYAGDIEWHAPNSDIEKVYDVSIVGNTYPNRVELMERLRQQGKRTYFKLGVGKGDAGDIYRQSIIGINWSSMLDLTCRVFELISVGIVPVVNRVPDLVGLFDEGQNYLGFDTIERAISQIDLALGDENLRNNIIANNLEIYKSGKHNWDARVQTILDVCKLT